MCIRDSSKDRLYMTVTDRKMNYGISRNNHEVVVKTKLPFHVCAISKREISSPACCSLGILLIIFNFKDIVMNLKRLWNLSLLKGFIQFLVNQCH